jgi:hypothetical protein
MNNLIQLLTISPSPSYTIVTVGVAMVVGFVAGYFIRAGVTGKHKKRVVKLENEMLSNHSHILELEKQLGQLRKDIH